MNQNFAAWLKTPLFMLVFGAVGIVGTVICAVTAHADILYLNEGEEFVGTLERIADDQITFTAVNGSQTQVFATETAHILISKLRPGDEVSRVEELTDPVVNEALARRPQAGEHPHADYVTLFKQRKFAWQKDGTIVYDRREIVQILKEPGLRMANRSVYYIKERESCELLFSHTYAPDGHVHHVTDDAVADEALLSSTPEYSRLRKLKFAMKKVDLGSVIDYSYRMVSRKPDAMQPYLIDSVFGQREPILHEELVVSFPKGVKLETRRFQWDQPSAPAFRESLANNMYTRTWTFKDTKGFIPEQNMPSTSLIFPRLMIYESATWDSLAKSFDTAVAAAEPNAAALASFVAECETASGTTPLDQARRLYEGVIRKIRLIGMDNDDMGSVAPLPVDVALNKRYGNNMARVTLLYYALRSIGIEARIGLVNTWAQDGIKEEVVNLGQAPYSILRIENDGQVIFVDCLSDYLPFGFTGTRFQGAAACFLDGDRWLFARIPDGEGAKNRIDQTVHVKVLPDGAFEVNDIRAYRGPFEVGLRTLRSAKEQEISNYAEQRVKQIHPNAELQGFTLSNLDDMLSPAVFSLRYRIAEAALRASDNLLAFRNLWINYSSQSGSLATRSYPMEYWTTLETANTILFQLPDSFVWVPWANSYQHSCGCVNFQSSLHQSGNTLVYSDRFQVNRKVLDPQVRYHHYRSCVLAMSELANQWLVLEKQEHPATPASASDSATVSEREPGTASDPGIGSGSVSIPAVGSEVGPETGSEAGSEDES